MKKRTLKKNRHELLLSLLEENPLLTDEELANKLQVSVQTIRLDRLALGLPELKERAMRLASQALNSPNPASQEVVGELLFSEPGSEAISRLVTDESMKLSRYNIVRGHFIFAQANSLAVATAEAADAITASAKVDFVSPVLPGETLIARARVERKDGKKSWVKVQTKAEQRVVFRGQFLVIGLDDPESFNQSLHKLKQQRQTLFDSVE